MTATSQDDLPLTMGDEAGTLNAQQSCDVKMTESESHQLDKKSKVIQQEPGMAMIKPEFIVESSKRILEVEFMPKDAVKELIGEAADEENGHPPKKRFKPKGRFKKRPRDKRADTSERFCGALAKGLPCRFGDKCMFIHDASAYMASRQPDISDKCYLYDTYGFCSFGVTCMFSSAHLTADYENVKDSNRYTGKEANCGVKNQIDKTVQSNLRKKLYDFDMSNGITADLRSFDILKMKNDADADLKVVNVASQVSQDNSSTEPKIASVSTDSLSESVGGATNNCSFAEHHLGVVPDNAAIRPEEKTKLDFNGKLYLAPLTTVGNLPFRRVCKQLGADITCSEMATCTGILQGIQSEWALLKRHPSEDFFGIQLCGAFPDTMSRTAQLLNEQCSMDFVDINSGCPIDMFYKKGEGCGLMNSSSKYCRIVKGMTSILNVPLTVKMRTGIMEGKNIAHTLIPRLKQCGVSLFTVHGRSREQRYTRQADWSYIDTCAELASPVPMFGNGDILSYHDYQEHVTGNKTAGCMIARGALIKPWIFSEIKQQRDWDISSSERLDMLKDFTNFGLEHWGSDMQGVKITRRFLLEWLSFLHRYIPVGVLERVPQRINEKPPQFVGRNDLETMMASSSCADWIRISEMLLGPVPSDFNFLPKHKANAYNYK